MANDGKNTSLGMDQNIEGALAYLLGWLTGVIFLLIEKDNNFVRYHAMQSIAVFVPLTIASIVISFIPSVIGFLLSLVLGIVSLVLWIFLMYQAFQGNRYQVPYAGEWAEKQVG